MVQKKKTPLYSDVFSMLFCESLKFKENSRARLTTSGQIVINHTDGNTDFFGDFFIRKLR